MFTFLNYFTEQGWLMVISERTLKHSRRISYRI